MPTLTESELAHIDALESRLASRASKPLAVELAELGYVGRPAACFVPTADRPRYSRALGCQIRNARHERELCKMHDMVPARDVDFPVTTEAAERLKKKADQLIGKQG